MHLLCYVNKWTKADNKQRKQPQNTKIGNSLITKNKHKTSTKWNKLGRINVDISDEIEKQLRIKTVEKFGGKKGDLSRAVQEAVKTWINQKEWSRRLFKPNN